MRNFSVEFKTTRQFLSLFWKPLGIIFCCSCVSQLLLAISVLAIFLVIQDMLGFEGFVDPNAFGLNFLLDKVEIGAAVSVFGVFIVNIVRSSLSLGVVQDVRLRILASVEAEQVRQGNY